MGELAMPFTKLFWERDVHLFASGFSLKVKRTQVTEALDG